MNPNEELEIEGKKYLSSKSAAKKFGYSNDYVGQLAREGKISAEKVGGSWFVDPDSVQDYKNPASPAGRQNSSSGHKAESAKDTPDTSAPEDSGFVYESEEGPLIPEIKKKETANAVSPQREASSADVDRPKSYEGISRLDKRERVKNFKRRPQEKPTSSILKTATYALMLLALLTSVGYGIQAGFTPEKASQELSKVKETVTALFVGNDDLDDAENQARQELVQKKWLSGTESFYESGKNLMASFFVTAGEFLNFVVDETKNFFARLFGGDEEVYVVEEEPIRIEPEPVERQEPAGPTKVVERIETRTVETVREVPASAPTASGGYLTESHFQERMLAIQSYLADRFDVETSSISLEGLVTDEQLKRQLDLLGGGSDSGGGGSKDTFNTITIRGGDISNVDITNSTGQFTGTLVGQTGSFTTLGVATSSPVETFSLNGAAYLSQITAPANTSNRLYNVGGDLHWAGGAFAGPAIGTWATDGTNVWRESGKVGVGTSSPQALLHALGTTEQLRLSYDALNYWTDTIASDGGRSVAGFGTDADLNFDFSGATDGDFSINADNLFVDTSTGLVGIGTTSPSQLLTVAGSGYFTGGLGIGVATSTPGVLETSGNARIGGDLSVIGDSTIFGDLLTIGTSSASKLVVNASVASDLIPEINAVYNLGSASFFWNDGFFDNIVANNISAGSTTISGTQSDTFTLNSDNSSADAENADLIFFRGTVVPNALITWDSTRDRFDINQPFYIENESSTTTIPTLALRASVGQSADVLSVASSSGGTLFNVTSTGNVGIGTSSPSSKLSVVGNGLFTGGLGIGTLNTTAGTLETAGAATFGGLLSFTGTDHGGIRLNNLSTTQRDALSPLSGLLVFNTTDSKAQIYNGTDWKSVGSTEIGSEVEGGTAGSVLFIDASGNLGQDNSNFFWNNTDKRLGIGTSTPDSALTVSGNGLFTGDLTINGSTTISGNLDPGFTEGSVIFQGANGLTQNNSQFFWNNSTNRLGVGTASPNDVLEISASSNPSLRLSEGGSTTSYSYIQDTSATALSLRKVSNSGVALIDVDPQPQDGTSDANFRFFRSTNTTGSTRFQIFDGDGTSALNHSIGNDAVIFNESGLDIDFRVEGSGEANALFVQGSDGNVGIGTASPGRALEISRAGDPPAVRLTNEDGAQSWEFQVDDTDNWIFRDVTDNVNPLVLSGDNTGEVLRVTGDRVGIGTASPGAELTIEAPGPRILLQDDSSSDSVARLRDASAGSGGVNGELTLWSGTTEAVKIAAFSGQPTYFNSGANVGIGTTSPGANLHISADKNASVEHNDAQLRISGTTNPTKRLNVGFDTTDNYGFIQAIESGVAGRNLVLNPQGGNVGIGTTTPGGYKLVLDDVGSSGGGLRLVNNTGDKSLQFWVGTNAAVIDAEGTTNLLFRTGGSDRIFIENSTGEVGIGTASPSDQLSVVTSATNDGVLLHFPSAGIPDAYTGVKFKVDTDTNDARQKGGVFFERTGSFGRGKLIFATDNNADETNVTNADARVTILADGNVGIGTASPVTKLEVEDNDSSVLGQIKVENAGTGDASMFFNAGGSVWALGLDNSDSDKFKISHDIEGADVGDETALTIQDNGNVGIGTTSPGAKLEVNGNILADSGTSGAGNLAYSFTDDTDTGIYSDNADSIRIQLGGVDEVTIFPNTFDVETNAFQFNAVGDNNERLCHTGVDGATLNLTPQDCVVAGEDFAEFSLVVSEDGAGEPEPGDVVYTIGNSPEDPTLTVKALTAEPYQWHSGVVSTNPFVDILGGEQYKEYNEEGLKVRKRGAYPVSLAGRVPVKASLENGPVEAGDPLVPSSLPGVAMKAVEPSYIIGFAQEAYDGSVRVSPQVAKQEETYNDPENLDGDEPYTSDPSKWPEGVGKIMVEYKPTYWLGNDSLFAEKTSTESKTTTTSLRGFINAVRYALKNLGIDIKNGLIKIAKLTVDRITAKTVKTEGIEITDKATGKTYCVEIVNEEWQKTEGVCDDSGGSGATSSSGPNIYYGTTTDSGWDDITTLEEQEEATTTTSETEETPTLTEGEVGAPTASVGADEDIQQATSTEPVAEEEPEETATTTESTTPSETTDSETNPVSDGAGTETNEIEETQETTNETNETETGGTQAATTTNDTVGTADIDTSTTTEN